MSRIRAAALALLVVLSACDSPSDAGVDATPRVGPDVATTIERDGNARVMVALEPGPVAMGIGGAGVAALRSRVKDQVDGFLRRVGRDMEVTRRFTAVPALAGTVRDLDALRRLAADQAVVRIDLDVGGGGALSTSVPHVGADTRHHQGNDGAGIVVAILDTGVDTDHPALQGRIVHEACTTASENCPGGSQGSGAGKAEDDAGHGTHVAGIMVSTGAVGAPGVAPGADLVAIKMMYACGFSGCFDAFSEVVAALDYLIDHHDELGTRAVTMSLGTSALFTGVCDESTAFNMAGAAAANTLRELGVLVFAASMNDGSSTAMASPACLENVISVASVHPSDALAFSSNTNAYTDLAAPGVSIVSLAVGGGTLSASGTSMATPHVTGCAALLFQAQPDWTANDVLSRLLTSTVHVTDPDNDVVMPRLDCVAEADPPAPPTTVTVTRPGAGTDP